MNNNKYTMKYIEENKHKKYNENELLNKNNSSPININCNKNKYSYRNTSNINKPNNNSKNEKCDKHKNGSMKKNSNIKFTIKDKEKTKDSNNNNIHEYKINNMSSSYNNNYTNIKTNKIVFIDLKDNDNNFLKNDIPNENKNENNRFSPRTPNTNQNQNAEEDINDNNYIKKTSNNLRSSRNNIKNNSNNNNINNNKLNTVNNKKNNNAEDKNKLSCIKSKNINNNINKNKFLNLTIQKLDKNNSDNNSNFTILEEKERNKPKSNKIIEIKGLSYRENSYYILSKSPVLRLFERMIFSRSTLGLRYILPKEVIIDDHYIILQNKIDELSKKINLCDKILNTPFTASKTADITLNFITSFQEIEFREFPILLSSDEEKKYYLNYLKILYNLLEEEIEINISGNSVTDQNNMIINLRKDLYSKIKNKGFKSLRDYLYNVFITKKDYIKDIPKIAEINYLISQVNNMFEIHNSLKICKFISFTMYLVKEIVKFGNNIKSTVELKIKAKNLIDIINKKLYKFKDKYKK